MEVWIVEDGEKTGPFQTYEIRERISDEDLSGDELAWHRNQDGWIPLKEMEVFRAEFEKEPEPPAEPPPLPARPQPFVRFWARWFDVFLFLFLLLGTLHIFGVGLAVLYSNSIAPFLIPIAFALLEAISLHQYKTTPGKFLLGVKVMTLEEERLTLGQAVARSFRICILGMGLMQVLFPPLIMLCHCFCLWFLMKHGQTPWDFVGGTRQKVVGPLFYPTVLFMFLFAFLFFMVMLLGLPEVQKLVELQASS